MPYQVLLHPKAASVLSRMNTKLKERITDKLKELCKNSKKGEQLVDSRFWKIRIGDYRAIYEIDEDKKNIIVLFVGHRSKVYDDFSRLV